MNLYCHFSKVDNIGDLVACPLDYFSDLNGIKTNFLNLDKTQITKETNLIFGGGGMLHDWSKQKIEQIVSLTNRGKIASWGIGINNHNEIQQIFPSFLSQFDLVGLRDFPNSFNYVPCVSCMDDFFNNQPNFIHDTIVYEHYDMPILLDFPKQNNRKINRSLFQDVLLFLSSGETIITNSYHGAYWGLLLNRKVLIWEPFSNRFLGYKPHAILFDRNNWKEKLKIKINIYPKYLNECRNANRKFKTKVLELLD